MKIQFEDRIWDYDEDRITVQQAMAIHLAYGMTLQEFVNGIGNLDPRSLQSAYWLMLAQNGVRRAIKDCDFPLVDFITAYAAAQKADAEPEPEERPTSQSPIPGALPSPMPETPTTMTPMPPDPLPVPTGS